MHVDHRWMELVITSRCEKGCQQVDALWYEAYGIVAGRRHRLKHQRSARAMSRLSRAARHSCSTTGTRLTLDKSEYAYHRTHMTRSWFYILALILLFLST